MVCPIIQPSSYTFLNYFNVKGHSHSSATDCHSSSIKAGTGDNHTLKNFPSNETKSTAAAAHGRALQIVLRKDMPVPPETLKPQKTFSMPTPTSESHNTMNLQSSPAPSPLSSQLHHLTNARSLGAVTNSIAVLPPDVSQSLSKNNSCGPTDHHHEHCSVLPMARAFYHAGCRSTSTVKETFPLIHESNSVSSLVPINDDASQALLDISASAAHEN